MQPYAAVQRTHFDAHALLAEGDYFISRALDDQGIDFLRSPRGNGERARFVIASTDVVDAAAAIIAAQWSDGLYMVAFDGGGRARRHIVPINLRRLTRSLMHHGARVFLPICSVNGQPLGGEELGCDIEVWPVSPEGVLKAPWQNGWAEEISRDQWTEASSRSDHRPEVISERNLFDLCEPIDLVYTWVDGSDAEWAKQKARAMEDQTLNVNETATTWARFESNDELKYSLRSVAMYASWVRRIFIVTDRQCPAWLKADHPQITVVDHSDIFPEDASLPTFNSHAIESRLHHIAGLSERYLYLNDDVFFGRPVRPEVFFEANGIAKFFPSEGVLNLASPTASDLPVISAGKRNREVIRRSFAATITQKLKHAPHSQQRSVLFELEYRYPELFRQLARSQFRDPSDVSVAASLQHYYAYGIGKALPVNQEYFYLDISDRQAERSLNGLARTRQFDFFCLNNVDSALTEKHHQARLLEHFLQNYFPMPSPYEIVD